MIRLITFLAAIGLSASVAAFQPRTGLWYNAAQSGDGFNIEIQNGVLVLTVYSYEASGDSEWYLASGAMTNANHTFTATLDKYRNGRCISCAYTGRPTQPGNDGTVTITFTSETAATVSLPGGRVTAIEPYDFGYGAAPGGLLGEWVFFYDIISTFGERFRYTTIASATSKGNGVVVDLTRNGTCELQTSGSLVGYVLCFDFDSTLTVVENQYHWRYGIEETFGGVYTFPPSGNTYSMKGMRTMAPNGSSKSLASLGDDVHQAAKIAEDRRQNRLAPVSDGELASAAEEMRQALLRAKQ